jgi:hypothetical protein
MELKNNVLCYYDSETDWYVDVNVKNTAWSDSNVATPETTTYEILSSDTDGYTNTMVLSENNSNSIFGEALNSNAFEEGICGYIPSYIEMELFSCNLSEINKFLSEHNKPTIVLDNCWVSEEFNDINAWTTEGDYLPKNTVLNYYIFGKQITC